MDYIKTSKKKNLIVISYFIFYLSSNILGQSYPKPIMQGPYGGDMRIRPSYGIMPDAQYENCKKIKDLNSKKIAIAVKFPPVLTITNDNFWKDKCIDYDYWFNVEDFLKTLIFSKPAQRVYNFKLFEDEDSKKLDVNFWNSNLKLSRASLGSLVNKYDSDYLILIRGVKSTFFTTGMKNEGSQGLYAYGQSKVYMIYACQIVTIYNLRTGKPLRKSIVPQESADIIQLHLEPDFMNFTPEQSNLIDKFMKERLKNNLKQSFKLLGLE